jgi:hypothetical protein
MSYLGSVPLVGNFKKLDNISAQFNGVQTTFSLTSNSVAVKPGTAMNLLISMNGVLQEPGTAYNVNMTQIVFPEPPQVGETFFGVMLGQVGTALTPTDGSVSNSILAENSVSSTKIVDGAVLGVKLATDAVSTTKIQDGSVTSAKLAVGAVSFADVASKPTTISGYGITDAAGTGANTFTGNQTGGDNRLVQWLMQDTGLVFVNAGTQ